MTKKTQQREEEEYKRVDPATLQPILTVYGEKLHILKNAYTGKRTGPAHLIPVYYPDGRRMIEESPIDGKKYFYQIVLHPDNIDHFIPQDCTYTAGDRVLVNKRIGIVREALPGNRYRVSLGGWGLFILHVDELLLAPPENDKKGHLLKGKG
jgi:hypothetical protein